MKKYFKYSCTNSLIFGTVAWSRVCNENCIANRNLICRHQTGNRSWLKSTRWSLCVCCLSWWFSSERKQTRINGLIHDVLTCSRDIFQRYFPNSPFMPGVAVILQCFFFFLSSAAQLCRWNGDNTLEALQSTLVQRANVKHFSDSDSFLWNCLSWHALLSYTSLDASPMCRKLQLAIGIGWI